MSSNERLKVKQYIEYYLDFDGYVVDLITRLQRMEEEWPGCYIQTWRDGDPSFWYERPETDVEYDKRVADLKLKEERALVQKREQYEKLKKELGLDDKA